MDKAFSSIDLVYQCLIDRERVCAFDRALREMVKPNYFVLDVGTGSGSLAMLAARAGAKHVTAIERDEYIATVARENVARNHLQHIIEVVVEDATSFQVPKNKIYDVVTMEMLTTGMIEEAQVPALNNLHRQNAISSSTILIPCRQDTYLALCETDANLYGFKFNMVHHLWRQFSGHPSIKLLSDTVLLNSISYSVEHEEAFLGSASVVVQRDGMLNNVYLSSTTMLSEKIAIAARGRSRNFATLMPRSA